MDRISWKFQRGVRLCQQAGAALRTSALDCLGNTARNVTAKSFPISQGRCVWDRKSQGERLWRKWYSEMAYVIIGELCLTL